MHFSAHGLVLKLPKKHLNYTYNTMLDDDELMVPQPQLYMMVGYNDSLLRGLR